MGQDTKQMMLLKGLSGKKVEADFTGGDVSSDGGLLLFREIASDLNMFEKVAAAIDDNRHSSYVKHDIIQLLKQRVFQITAGYEDANDADQLRKDPVFKISCGKELSAENDLASQPTISRFENTPRRATLYKISEALLDVFIKSYDKPPEGILIDLDDTDDPTYGNQQLTLFNAYHDCHCYMPMHIYEGKTGKLITTILRPGKRPSGKEIVTILKRIVGHIRKAWPGVGILYRGDSSYGAPEVYSYCKEHNIKFICGLPPNKILMKRSRELQEEAEELFELDNKPVKLYDDFFYQAGSWELPNRVIVKAEYNSKGANTRFVVTDLEHSNPRLVYKTIYCNRGVAELMIKDHKNHTASDRTSCSKFQANCFRLLLHSMAYILLHHFRTHYLKETKFATSQFDTIRNKIIKIGARVYNMVTKIKIELPGSYPYKQDFFNIWKTTGAPSYG